MTRLSWSVTPSHQTPISISITPINRPCVSSRIGLDPFVIRSSVNGSKGDPRSRLVGIFRYPTQPKISFPTKWLICRTDPEIVHHTKFRSLSFEMTNSNYHSLIKINRLPPATAFYSPYPCSDFIHLSQCSSSPFYSSTPQRYMPKR